MIQFHNFFPVFLAITVGFIQHLPFGNETLPTVGEQIPVHNIIQHDLDADGNPDVTEIETSFATESDLVIVYDQNGDMSVGNQWEKVTDFQDDLWIFDVGADGTAQLIVDFAIEDDWYVALVYDDITGDGQVSYQADNNQITIGESDFWHVKVKSRRLWDQPGGLWNSDITMLIDGYDGLQLFMGADTHDLSNAPDGVIDWQIEIGDKDGNGVIDYLLQRIINPILASYQSARLRGTHIRVQMADRIPTPYEDFVFWPLLVGRDSAVGAYFDHTPAVAVDWSTGVIFRIGILGYPIENGYHVLSHLPLEKHHLNTLNWEVPMAYYDMADDQDGWPELQVRFELAVPYDPYFPRPYEGQIETPNLEVTQSWDQDNDNRWDYKISLGANYEIDEVIEFPDFDIKVVPHDKIISWIRDRTWDVALFVFDDLPKRDSEGMLGRGWFLFRGYAGGERFNQTGVKDQYLMGFSDKPPVEAFQDIQEGMRGEYSFQYFNTPRIYLSAIDRQLHLHSAEKGVWNWGEGRYLRYENLDGDAYLDQWREEHDGSVIQQLNYAQGMFIYGGNSSVRIIPTEINQSLIETQPPGSYEEWTALSAELERYQQTFAPDDLAAMLAQFSGPELSIQGASLRDFRLAGEGFRFVLALQPGYRLEGEDLLHLGSTGAGEYVVVFDGTDFTVRPLTPAAASLADLRLEAAAGAPPQLGQWANLRGELRNQGLEDLHDLALCAYFTDPLGETQVLTTTIALLAGESSQVLEMAWAPDSAGEWGLTVGSDCQREEGSYQEPNHVLASTRVDVQPVEGPPTNWLLTLGGLLPQTAPWLLIFVFVAIALLAGGAAFLWFRSYQAPDQDQ